VKYPTHILQQSNISAAGQRSECSDFDPRLKPLAR